MRQRGHRPSGELAGIGSPHFGQGEGVEEDKLFIQELPEAFCTGGYLIFAFLGKYSCLRPIMSIIRRETINRQTLLITVEGEAVSRTTSKAGFGLASLVLQARFKAW
jgi:hypothetical protein